MLFGWTQSDGTAGERVRGHLDGEHDAARVADILQAAPRVVERIHAGQALAFPPRNKAVQVHERRAVILSLQTNKPVFSVACPCSTPSVSRTGARPVVRRTGSPGPQPVLCNVSLSPVSLLKALLLAEVCRASYAAQSFSD